MKAAKFKSFAGFGGAGSDMFEGVVAHWLISNTGVRLRRKLPLHCILRLQRKKGNAPCVGEHGASGLASGCLQAPGETTDCQIRRLEILYADFVSVSTRTMLALVL